MDSEQPEYVREDIEVYGLVVQQALLTDFLAVMLWGIHLSLSVWAVVILRRKGFASGSGRILVGVIATLVVIYTLLCLGTVAYDLDRMGVLADRLLGIPAMGRIVTLRKMLRFLGNDNSLLIAVADAVIVWRCWQLWMRSKLWMIVPVMLVVLSLGLSIACGVLNLPTQVGPVSNNSAFSIVGMASWSTSICTNLVTTLMIAFQAYRGIDHDVKKPASRPWRILFFLVEAGLLFLIVQVITCAVVFTASEIFTPLDWAAQVFIVLHRFVSVAYPALVIIVIHNTHSLASDSTVAGNSGMRTIDTHISFARGPGSRVRTDTNNYSSSADVELGADDRVPSAKEGSSITKLEV